VNNTNILKGQIVYLCGSIDRVKDCGVSWRKKWTPVLRSLGLGVIDPTDKPSSDIPEDIATRERMRVYKSEGKYDEVANWVKQLVAIDLFYVDKSDILITYLDIDEHPCGTYNEIFLAAEQQKPVIIVCPHGKSNVPNWLFGRLKHKLFFGNFEEMIEYLKRADAGLEPELIKRSGFDYNKIFGLTPGMG